MDYTIIFVDVVFFEDSAIAISAVAVLIVVVCSIAAGVKFIQRFMRDA